MIALEVLLFALGFESLGSHRFTFSSFPLPPGG